LIESNGTLERGSATELRKVCGACRLGIVSCSSPACRRWRFRLCHRRQAGLLWAVCLSHIFCAHPILCGRELARDLARSGSRFWVCGVWGCRGSGSSQKFRLRRLTWKRPPSKQGVLAPGWASTSSKFPHSDDAPWARVERTSLSRRSPGILPVDPLRGACTRPAPKSRLAVSVRACPKIKSNGNGNGNGNGNDNGR